MAEFTQQLDDSFICHIQNSHVPVYSVYSIVASFYFGINFPIGRYIVKHL